MANTFKVLFRGAATTNSATLYTTPANTTTLVSSIVVANASASSQTYSIFIDGTPLAELVSLASRDSVVIEPKQVLNAASVITGLASSSNTKFHISGLEIA